MNSPILFLTVRIGFGYGVALVLEELSRRLERLGFPVIIGCSELDEMPDGLDVRVIEPTDDALLSLVRSTGANVVIAHSSPFFELLPALRGNVDNLYTYVWEHGDPTPEFFSDDAEERREQIAAKIASVYPNVDGVIAISKFIRNDINYPRATIVYNGCAHVAEMGSKPLSMFDRSTGRPLRVGSLMRMGSGEAMYKGNQLFLDISKACKERGIDAEFEVMGRGTQEDADFFEQEGLITHLNATDEEKSRFLRELDVFISCSQWEGFNLPLVEAQALGTLGLAFDAGAHPEVTPFVFSNVFLVPALIARYAENKELLYAHSRTCYDFVRRRFRWDKSVYSMLQALPSALLHGELSVESASLEAVIS